MTGRKLSALRKKAGAMPHCAMRTPASAGPTMRAPLNMPELSAMALVRSALPTISTMNDWRVGMSTVLATP
jgi:hypothetical protein